MINDLDGDQVTVRGVFSEEANEELKTFVNSKAMYFNLGGHNTRESSKEAIQSLYNLTLVLSDDIGKMTQNIKF